MSAWFPLSGKTLGDIYFLLLNSLECPSSLQWTLNSFSLAAQQVTTYLFSHNKIMCYLPVSAGQKSEVSLAGFSALGHKAGKGGQWDEMNSHLEHRLFFQARSGCWQNSVAVIVGLRSLLSCWLWARSHSLLLEAAHRSFPCGPTGSSQPGCSLSSRWARVQEFPLLLPAGE